MHVRGNFIYLLVSLLGFLAFMAIFTQYPKLGGWRLLSIAFEASLIVAMWSLVKQRTYFIIGVILVSVGAIAILAQSLNNYPGLIYLNMAAVFAFYLMTTAIAFGEVIRPTPIDLNKIIGSICIYLLAGINWAFMYYFADLIHPGSFSGISITDVELRLFEMTYFSYVTLSTLGYGDVLPIEPVVQTLAVIEALFGQFYIAILVAILVGTHISAHGPSSPVAKNNK